MRLSADQDDPGFYPWCVLRNRDGYPSVWVDGVEVHDVITVDDDVGLVVRYRRDAKGHFVLDGEDIAREELRGDVLIQIKTDVG